ncbi:MAG: HDOD domain-containing protein [Sedimentisphaerales bacterium]|nr:HDOD domain-containing protein [Sedimentisphaerales bacterium]
MLPKVLLVDDEPNIVRGLRHTLRKENYEILCAGWAQEALEIMSHEPIDVVVSDEQMPSMPGSTMLAKIRQEYPQTIRILLTGQSSLEGAVRAVNQGDIYRFLQKPCNGLDLVITIRRALQYKELVARSWRLLKILQLESAVLQSMQSSHPELKKQLANKWSIPDEGKIEGDYHTLIQNLDSIADEAKKLFGIDLPPIQGDQVSQSVSNKPTDKSFSAALNSTPTEPDNAQTAKTPATAVQNATTQGTATQEATDQEVTIQETTDQTATTYADNDNQKQTDQHQVESPPSPSSAATEQSGNPAGEITISEFMQDIQSIKDIKPILSRTEIYELLDECNELKALSPTVTQVLKLTQSARCSIDQVVKVIKQDHAISLKILKLANSAAYTRGEPVDTVQKAVMRIGLSQIRQTVLNITVVDQFSNNDQEVQLSVPQFWEHSISTGLIAAEITRNLEGKEHQIDTAFTMGLLHDVGRLVYLEMLGSKYNLVMQSAQLLELPLEQVESRMLLVNHADAMDRILHKWKFSKEMVNSIALHQLSLGNIRRMAPRTLNEASILAMSNRLSHALLMGTSGNLSLYSTEEFANLLKLDNKLINYIETEIPGQTDDIKFAMLASSNQHTWPRVKDELTKQLNQPFRPLVVSAEPEFDSIRIFCDQLKEVSQDEPPNIGIVHIKSGREREAVTKRYLGAEAEVGVTPLPLIIFSPKGDIQLEERNMANRRFELLPMPILISRIVGAFNQLVQ